MSETRFTLCDLFNAKEEVEQQKDQLAKSPSFDKVKEKMSEQGSKFPLLAKFSDKLIPLILGKLDELLDIDIFQDILGETWSQQQELAQYADSGEYPPTKTVLVPILEHSLDSEHNPFVEPTIGGLAMGKIELQVEASFIINGVILEICNAKIMKLHLDGILGGGVLKFAGIPFLEKETATLDLPGTIDLGEGISIFKNKAIK
ncbi:hypothetical protein Xen7305DRAFT_00022170 [Xenococcus sp. PCC 7305]|uniref:hypothetical protein n=1 Tax=Xenococcus sp. PCC 7305 TaxID=102125 RepID=UPI0002AC1F95|nr:hypothetical protein [Xenococcus sp. PCC 7305]ELS02503.1 hypothetical protein Xen7305DRAFT_00022170 [Xenococcus sp. PCC 7305]